MSAKNDYMEQVLVQQASVEGELRRKRRAPLTALRRPRKTVADTGVDSPAVDVRITGFWRWRNVIVPPNVYVVHTRRGQDEPLHVGLGTSFRFNPMTDAYLTVPASMQTVIINADCICREKQGILVQGYVQWAVDDFGVAYRRLDFSDAVDPMRVVNIQIREQAVAVIKDTVSTMSLDRVLSDRQPIMKELTSRLRSLMEGQGQQRGLGLRVVTVQIKEAVVSSPGVWASLQRPFRAEREKDARLAEIEQDAIVQNREAEARKASEVLKLETEAEVARLRADSEARAFDRHQAETVRRVRVEAQAAAASIEHEKTKAAKQAELEVQKIEMKDRTESMWFESANRRALAQIETEAARRRVTNEVSEHRIRELLIDALPEIVERMPKELKSVQIGGGTEGISNLIPALKELVDTLREPKNGA